MGFAPTPEQYRAYEYASWHEDGKKPVHPAGGARSTFWTNVARGQAILRRIEAVGGAANSTELRRKELEQSPEYIAEQKRLVDEKESARLAEIARLALIEKNRLAVLENLRLELIKEKIENERLQEIENQRLLEIENQKIIPAVVASSSLLPLGIIAFLLINSRKRKK